MFNNYIRKNTLSKAESCEEQDGSKQNFVGQTTAELQAVFQLDVAKDMEKK